MKAEQVAKMLEKHEEDANRRVDRIEKILDKLDMRMWGLGVLIVGVSSADKAKRRKEIERNRKKSPSDPSAYRFASDFTSSGKRRKTKESKYTKEFRKRFGKRRG